MMVDLQGHKVCEKSTWENIERQKVIEIPFGIDGMKLNFIKDPIIQTSVNCVVHLDRT